MKKMIALSILACSSAFALSDSDDYASAWRDIYSSEYVLACYHLKNIDQSYVEDELHVLLMKLFIATKRGATSTQYDIIEQIEDIVEDEYIR